MGSSLHGILLQKLQCAFCHVRRRAVAMDHQFPISAHNLNSTPISKWSSNLDYAIHGVQFDHFGENSDQVKADRIPNYWTHNFSD
jgi:hypothetical protein